MRNQNRAISSAGSEHLVYTEGVGGSNPSSPTKKLQQKCWSFFYLIILLAIYIHKLNILL